MNMTAKNKATVKQFNKECIELGIENSFKTLLADDVINHSAPKGLPNGPESFHNFLNGILRKGFSELIVEIQEQIAEGDLVATRKKITGVHSGEIFGISPSHKKVEINVIDIIRLNDGKYVEHWGQSNFAEVVAEIKG